MAALGNAHLITYALGSGAETSVLKQLSCQNNGILYTVADNDNLADVMAEYYKLLAPMLDPCTARYINYAVSQHGVPQTVHTTHAHTRAPPMACLASVL